MAENIATRWSNYRPTKGVWFGSCAACVVATLIVGFSWGGWVTESTAEEQVASATEEARAMLAADICQYRFLESPDAAVQLAALKEADSWKRDSLIEDAGWVTFASMEGPVDGAGELCADRLAEMELPPEGVTAAAPAATVTPAAATVE